MGAELTTLLLQMLLFTMPALLYIWMVRSKKEGGLFFFTIVLIAVGLLAGGHDINRLAPLLFLPLALLGLMRVWKGGQVPRFGPLLCGARPVLIGAIWGGITAIGILLLASFIQRPQIDIFTVDELPRLPWLVLIGAGLGPAIGEEVFFRGVVLSELEQKLGNARVAIFLTAIYFTMTHLNRIALSSSQMLSLGGLYTMSLVLGGIACGYLKIRYGLSPAMAWHGFFNFTILSLA